MIKSPNDDANGVDNVELEWSVDSMALIKMIFVNDGWSDGG